LQDERAAWGKLNQDIHPTSSLARLAYKLNNKLKIWARFKSTYESYLKVKQDLSLTPGSLFNSVFIML